MLLRSTGHLLVSASSVMIISDGQSYFSKNSPAILVEFSKNGTWCKYISVDLDDVAYDTNISGKLVLSNISFGGSRSTAPLILIPVYDCKIFFVLMIYEEGYIAAVLLIIKIKHPRPMEDISYAIMWF